VERDQNLDVQHHELWINMKFEPKAPKASPMKQLGGPCEFHRDILLTCLYCVTRQAVYVKRNIGGRLLCG